MNATNLDGNAGGVVPLGDAAPPPTLAQLEGQAIDAAMARFSNNRTKAARAIGISVRTLQRRLAHHGGGLVPCSGHNYGLIGLKPGRCGENRVRKPLEPTRRRRWPV